MNMVKKEVSRKTTVKKTGKIEKKPVSKIAKSSANKGKKETVKKPARAAKPATEKKAAVKPANAKKTAKPEYRKIPAQVFTIDSIISQPQDNNINHQTRHRRPLIVFPK